MSESSTFMPKMKNETEVDLESGVKVRIYRNEPFRFMGEIHKWLEGLKIGEIQAFHMNTDTNGWVNFAVAYKEPRPLKPEGPDTALVLFDAVMALKDLTEVVNKLHEKLLPEPPVDAA